MNLTDIRALVEVVDSGSLAHAAVKLGLTQPAISRRIQRLEEELRVKLLDRDVKPARLTFEGKAAYAECVRVLSAAHGLKSAVGHRFDATRPLRIGVSLGAADLVLSAILPAPEACGPTTLEMEPSYVVEESVAGRRVDVGLVFREAGRETSAGERLARLPVSIIASRSLRLPEHASLKALRGQRWVLCPGGCGYRRALEHGLYGASQPLDIAVSLWGFEKQAAIVAQGVGLGLVPQLLLQRSAYASELKVIKVSDFQAALDLWLIWPGPADALDPRVAPIRAALASSLQPATLAS